MKSTDTDLVIKPIGVIRTSMQAKFDAPHQPNHSKKDISVVELLPNSEFYQAVQDLKTFSHIWLIWWFHKNNTWKPKVRPPRGPNNKRGVLATRSPHRPNPIGMTAVELIKVVKNKIYIGNHDLIDGTPIIDIKPYIPDADCFPNANSGWLETVELTKGKDFIVEYSDLAKKQLEWFESNNINFIDRALEILLIDPAPQKTRRIMKIEDGYRMGCGGWRIFFNVEGNYIKIRNFYSGYPQKNLIIEKRDEILDFEKHLDFYKIFPN